MSLHRRGYGISVCETIDPPHANGRVYHSDRIIFVRLQGTPDMCYTMAHELGHLVYRRSRYTYGVAEILSDMFASSLLFLFGINRMEISADYVLSWLTYEEISDEDWVLSMRQATDRAAKKEAKIIWRLLSRCPQ